MLAIRKWDPLRDLTKLHGEMDDLFRRSLGDFTPMFYGESEWMPSLESYRKDGKFIVKADLPGIDPKDVDISVSGNKLTIKGERKERKEETDEGYILRETCYGKFERGITLDEDVLTDNIHATYKDGVLEVAMPLKAKSLPRKINVEVEEGKHEEGRHKGRTVKAA